MKRTSALIFALSSLFGCKDKPAAPATVAIAPAPSAQEPTTIGAPADLKEPPPDAKKTASGLVTRILTAGTGQTHPQASDTVTVHYTGWTADGKMFDSSIARNAPASLTLTRALKGWSEGVQLMVVGEKRRLWVPGSLGYGEQGATLGSVSGPLVFDVELLAINQGQH